MKTWHMRRVEEGRGFVAKCILKKVLYFHICAFGASFFEDFGSAKRVLTVDEIYKK